MMKKNNLIDKVIRWLEGKMQENPNLLLRNLDLSEIDEKDVKEFMEMLVSEKGDLTVKEAIIWLKKLQKIKPLSAREQLLEELKNAFKKREKTERERFEWPNVE